MFAPGLLNNINKANCYEWLGSSNYSGCIQGFEVSLLKTIKDIGRFDSSKINNFIVNENELFITNVVHGIQPITIYRKKSYTTTVSQNLLAKLNMSLRLS